MTTKKTNFIKDKAELAKKVSELRGQLLTKRLDIKAGMEKNTNAHKPLKRELAQLLTKLNQL